MRFCRGGVDFRPIAADPAVQPQSSSPSTQVDKGQRQRERAEEERARWAAINAEARLRARGKISHTTAGRALFQEHAEKVSIGLGLTLEEVLANPNMAGPNYAAWPLVLEVTNRGPRPLAAIALIEVLNHLGQQTEQGKLAKAIGKALQDELRAGRVERRSQDLLRLIKRRRGAKALSNPAVLRQIELDPSGWAVADQRAAGMLLLQVILRHSPGLITTATVQRRGRPCVVVRGAPEALATLRAAAPRPAAIARLPMTAPPRPWQGMHGGGHLTSRQPLVRSRAGMDLSYLTPEAMSPVIRCVNYLQGQQLKVSGGMVQLQRRAWDAGLRGLFPCSRDPMEPPPRPSSVVGPDGMREWRRLTLQAADDRRQWQGMRQRIERGISTAEQLADAPCWFAHFADFRGRLYSANRFCTHQGPDWEKATIGFRPEPVPSDGIEWMLKAAAGHWGVRAGWSARLQWGRERLQSMVAAAEAPLERLELWRDAKEPWQYLQLCRAIAVELAEPGTASGVPIRFDQSCSGAGIAACLVRDRPLARLCNIVGSTPRDLYSHVAELLTHRLQLDLSNGTGKQRLLAEFWLRFGIDRSLCKEPTMTSLYGVSWIGMVDSLAAVIQARRVSRLADWEEWVLRPARYLAGHFKALLKVELSSVMALDDWLRATSRQVVRTGRPMQWASPMGLTLRLGAQHDPRSRVTTLSRGARRWQQWTDHGLEGELSARATNRGITPNVIHSFDAAFCHAVITTAADHGAPLLTNHDCFASSPRWAGWLHHTLGDQLRTTYMPEWLLIMRDEIACSAGGLTLRDPPHVGTLCPGEIGNNPHAFS